MSPQAAAQLLEDLTEAQRTAVLHREGPMLVLAGPGSGKTRVITRRVAALIEGGVPPWQILAVTFTNKAAGEMRERIASLLPGGLDPRSGLVVSTFHAVCARILRRYADRAGLDPSFTIYDSDDQRDAVKEAIAESEVGGQMQPAAVHGVISRAKNELRDAAAFLREARDFHEKLVARVFAAYEAILARNNAVDFDDLLLRTARLLSEDEAARRELQERFRWILVDEYQDTNRAQFLIVRTLAEGSGNIFVVGDPDQSIYGWRGADISNILDFEAHFPRATIVPLGENFRSTGHIVAASAGLIDRNAARRAKQLYTALGDGEAVCVRQYDTSEEEADGVAATMQSLAASGMPWREMAVLYRINAVSRGLEAAFRRRGIPYAIVRGTAFFDRREVRDALAYLRVAANPADSVSLRRIVNLPARGLGSTSLDRIEQWGRDRRLALLEALRQADAVPGLATRARAAAIAFASMIDRWRTDAAAAPSRREALRALVDAVVVESGLREHHATAAARPADERIEEGADRVANLDELVSAAAQWDPSPDPVRPVETLADRLAAWLEAVALVSDADAVDPARGTVSLMTLHAAKGLEFEAVAIVGVEHGLLPHARSDGDLEEERRLLFVGMTRARRRLLLTYAGLRTTRGWAERTIRSPFLAELPEAHLRRVGSERRRGLDESLRDRAAEGDTVVDEGMEFDPGIELDEPRIGAPFSHPAHGLGRIHAAERTARGWRVRVFFSGLGMRTIEVDA